MDEGGKTSEDGAFWRFSLAFYERPGVADALIALQDRDGFDVNLILFALWLGISGRHPLDSGVLAAAERAIGTIRAGVVEPLRSLRRNLKHQADEDIQRFRESIKALTILDVLESRRGDGTYLKSLDGLRSGWPATVDLRSKDFSVLDLLEVRKMIEPKAARLAAARATETPTRFRKVPSPHKPRCPCSRGSPRSCPRLSPIFYCAFLLGPHPPARERLYVAVIRRYDGHGIAIGRDEYLLGCPCA